ncbi:phage tail terminator family protein [Chengkuizengella marina]|uniref:Uncharacterized protein n=1 Tax=Chengkuizengella marina TaxID=2507566 RepID=A0A6N9Q771_9BACL|nr:hypothetical protein [Chengkuizengella marina]NBI30716.1 hypothetical protein [Chengkuizengella marina]
MSLEDINIAINDNLIAEFEYDINSKDVKEGFSRPSFFVSFDNVSRSSSEYYRERALTVRIYFFPKSRYEYSLEILDVQERLENLFDLKLNVVDRKLNIHEVRSEVTDGVLSFHFDLQYLESKEVEESEMMQELEYNE